MHSTTRKFSRFATRDIRMSLWTASQRSLLGTWGLDRQLRQLVGETVCTVKPSWHWWTLCSLTQWLCRSSLSQSINHHSKRSREIHHTTRSIQFRQKMYAHNFSFAIFCFSRFFSSSSSFTTLPRRLISSGGEHTTVSELPLRAWNSSDSVCPSIRCVLNGILSRETISDVLTEVKCVEFIQRNAPKMT